MKRGTKVFLTFFFLLFMAFAAAAAVSMWFFMKPTVTRDSLLVVDLSGVLVEPPTADGLGEIFGNPSLSVADVVDSIVAAADDDRIEGLLLLMDSPAGLNLAKAYEIREALELFRDSNKPTHAYLEHASTVSYYLASACENIYLMPGGELWTTGFFIQMPFFKGSLEKLGIEPDFYAYHEYKSAADTYRRKEMSEPDREQLNALLDNWYGQIRDDIAQSRRISAEQVEATIDNSPLVPQEAYDSGFVDALLYWEQVHDRLDGTVDGEKNARFTYLDEYRHSARKGGHRRIAVIYAVGAIMPGESQESLFGPPVLGSDTVARAIRQARENPGIEAIVLRVDSPGGSAQASDEIWHEVILCKEADKPIVVSMSWLAASGGYWISMGADHIVADPITVTGSIGVVAGKLDWSGFYEWIGMSHESLQRGRNAGMFSDTSKFSASEAERMKAWMTFIYDEFIRKVSEGRNIPEEKVREIAKGRVWSGEDALELGLVDELGGLRESIAAAKKLADIPSTQDVRIDFYPRPKSFLEAISEGGHRRRLGVYQELPKPVRDALYRARVWEQWEGEGALALDPLLWNLSIEN